MAYTQFISTDYVFTYTTIPKDVDVQVINKFIRKAQDQRIQPLLGHDLFYKLMNDFSTTGTYPGIYLTLMTDWVKNCLCDYVVYEALPSIYMSITNKSLVVKTSETSQPATLKEMEFMRNEFLNSAEWYGDRVIEFILTNQNSIPEYFTSTTTYGIRPTQTNYNSGIYTPPSRCGGLNMPIDWGNIPDNWPRN